MLTPVYGGSLHADVLRSWKAPGDKTDIPRLDITSTTNFNSQSNRFLIDASYLSIRNVTIYYDLGKNVLNRLNLDQARFSVTGENLALFAKRKGLNPTEGFAGTNANVYTPQRLLSAGISVTF